MTRVAMIVFHILKTMMKFRKKNLFLLFILNVQWIVLSHTDF